MAPKPVRDIWVTIAVAGFMDKSGGGCKPLDQRSRQGRHVKGISALRHMKSPAGGTGGVLIYQQKRKAGSAHHFLFLNLGHRGGSHLDRGRLRGGGGGLGCRRFRAQNLDGA